MGSLRALNNNLKIVKLYFSIYLNNRCNTVFNTPYGVPPWHHLIKSFIKNTLLP